MKHKDTQSEISTPIHQPGKQDLSRRKFLQTAAAAGMVAATAPIAGMSQSQPAKHNSGLEDPVEKILSRYGSEFGHFNRVG